VVCWAAVYKVTYTWLRVSCVLCVWRPERGGCQHAWQLPCTPSDGVDSG
jgi:hypothetical protein